MSSPAPAPERDETIPLAVKAAAILGAFFTIAAFGLFGGRTAASVALGAGIAVANLLAMRAIIRNLLRPPPDADADPDERGGAERPNAARQRSEEHLREASLREAKPSATDDAPPDKTAAEHAAAGKRGGVAWGVFAVLKMILLFGSVAILLTRGWVDPMPLVVGYGVLPLGIALGSLWSNLRPAR
jgi:hypothetical protein